MTFSIVGRDSDGTAMGVAVASKFLAAGAFVPAAAADAGAVATQAYANLALRTAGLQQLRDGVSSAELLARFFDGDDQREERQAGVVDRSGGAATFTGERCMPWAGGRCSSHADSAAGAHAAQGNMLAGPEVVDAMV